MFMMGWGKCLGFGTCAVLKKGILILRHAKLATYIDIMSPKTLKAKSKTLPLEIVTI